MMKKKYMKTQKLQKMMAMVILICSMMSIETFASDISSDANAYSANGANITQSTNGNEDPFVSDANTDEYNAMEFPAIIDSISTEITVEKSNIYHVDKTVRVYYNTAENKSLTMLIPFNNLSKKSKDEVENVNLTTDATMTSFTTKTTPEGENVIITDASAGKKYVDYKITYDYLSAGDTESKYDIFRQELVGFPDAPVAEMKFKVHMPEEYDQSDLYFTDISGNKITINRSNDGLDIEGYAQNKLDNGCVSMTMILNGKYFKNRNTVTPFSFLLGILSTCCLFGIIGSICISAYGYIKFGTNKIPEITIQKSLLKGLSPVDYTLIMTGGLTNETVMLYLMQLANEGYIAISDTTFRHQKNRSPENGYYFIKKKDYDGKNLNLKKMMNIIFAGSKTKVRPVDLSKHIYDKINKFRLSLLDVKQTDLWEINDVTAKMLNTISFIIPAVTCMVLNLYNLLAYTSIIHMFGFLCGLALTAGIYFAMTKTTEMIQKRNVVRGGVADIMTWIYVFTAILIVLVATGIIDAKLFAVKSWIATFSFVAEIICIYCSSNMKKRTEKGNIACAKILGFRQYLSEMTGMDMKRITVKDMHYPYTILPYAIAIDEITDGWLSQMNSALLENPTWYGNDSDDIFDIELFTHDWNRIVEVMLEKADD